jgi:hypothetical protein
MNLPVGRVASTLGTSMKYMRPAVWHMAGGAAAGAAASMITGDGSMGRDAALGALGGLAFQKGVHRDIWGGGRAGMTEGSFNVRNALQAAASRQKDLWKTL